MFRSDSVKTATLKYSPRAIPVLETGRQKDNKETLNEFGRRIAKPTKRINK
jgi:hypothetical protein